MGSALAVDWSEVRKCSEAGMPDDEIATAFDIENNAIRQRRFREKWITPAAIEQAAIIAQAKAKARGIGNQSVTAVTKGDALANLGESLLRNGERGTLLLSQIALASLERAMGEDGPKIDPLASIGDVMTAGKAVRLAAGMDRQDATQVNVSIGGWQASVAQAGAIQGFREVELAAPETPALEDE